MKNCIYVGDTRMDEVACRYAGIPFIWAAYGFGKSEKPAAVLYSFPEVESVIFDALKIYAGKKSKKSKKFFS